MLASVWARRAGSAIVLASSVCTKPGETSVTRSAPSVDSWRSASRNVRAAFLVAP